MTLVDLITFQIRKTKKSSTVNLKFSFGEFQTKPTHKNKYSFYRILAALIPTKEFLFKNIRLNSFTTVGTYMSTNPLKKKL